MSGKVIIYALLFAGSVIGGFIPLLWGADFLSVSSLVFSSLGSVVGIIIGLKITQG